ncbi:MAG: hypothetical protein NVSMB10_17440 [Steroidobacteraceae bacterium]
MAVPLLEPRKLIASSIALAIGFALMPLLIFLAGSMALGRYDGASASRIYAIVYGGLAAGSGASWTVVLGPLALYFLFKGLRRWWRSN